MAYLIENQYVKNFVKKGCKTRKVNRYSLKIKTSEFFEKVFYNFTNLYYINIFLKNYIEYQ